MTMENLPDAAPVPLRQSLSFKRLLVAACDVYSAGLIVYLILNLLFGDRLWPVALAQNLAPWLLLAGIGPLAAQLMMRERSEEHTSELQSPTNLVCRLLLEK